MLNLAEQSNADNALDFLAASRPSPLAAYLSGASHSLDAVTSNQWAVGGSQHQLTGQMNSIGATRKSGISK